jgi:hypothetical protein
MTMIEQWVVELFDIIFDSDSDMILGFWNNDSDSDIILFTLV